MEREVAKCYLAEEIREIFKELHMIARYITWEARDLREQLGVEEATPIHLQALKQRDEVVDAHTNARDYRDRCANILKRKRADN